MTEQTRPAADHAPPGELAVPSTGPVAPTGGIPARAAAVAAGFLLSLESEHTRRGYTRDLTRFFGWCTAAGLDPLEARRAHLDAYRHQLQASDPDTGRTRATSTVARALSAVSGFYRYAVQEDVLARSPAAALRRPKVTEQSQQTGLTRDELRALLAAAAADGARSHALITLLALNGLRIDEALSRDIDHLDHQRGHPVLHLRRKGGSHAVCVLAPPTLRALQSYLDGRDSGPIFITRTGRRLDEPAAWRLVRRLARRAGLPAAARLNPHSLRHSFITAALEAGVSLRDVQDAAGHADPRTTRNYDRARHNLDRAATYAVSAYLATNLADQEIMLEDPDSPA
ncbi:MAG: tyrosine-type recombinase/integrase [Dehalococcoidia bacterium]